jgi:hypothetical protein
MKTITTGASVPKAEPSLDGTPPRTPMWRTDATIGTVLGVAGRMAAADAATSQNERVDDGMTAVNHSPASCKTTS